jgi:hypothetical protein
MATRALIGWIETEAAGNQVLTSTYNHWDGNPDSLGVALSKHYSEPNKAKQIANQGYISFLDPKTGEIEAKHKDPADKTVLPDDFEEAMREVYSLSDSYGADYAYIYDHNNMEWVNARINGVQNFVDTFSMTGVEDQFNAYEGGDLADYNSIQSMEENYETKWKAFLNEGEPDIVGVAKSILRDKPNLDVYLDSLANDIRLNGGEDYYGWVDDDFEEDYENYMAYKMDY